MCGPSPPSPLSPKVHGTLLSSRTTDTPIRTRVCSYYSSRPPPKSGDRGDNGDRPRDLSIRDIRRYKDCDDHDAHDAQSQRFSTGDAPLSPEPRDRARGREPKEHKAVKERCRCAAQSAYLFPNVSPCSDRDRRPARPLGASIAHHTSSSPHSPSASL